MLLLPKLALACLCLASSWPAQSSADGDLKWWQNAVIYQVYPRSFKDSKPVGNKYGGVGDLKGITANLQYLQELGVTGIWMNPIYMSPQVDMGYDVSDFLKIDPMYGTMDDLKDLINKIHELGMKILVDLVPNHTSNKHPWFIEASKGNPNYTDYYVWSDHPNNWASIMGGSAWTEIDSIGKWYYHAFLPEQPDLNYYNDKVVQEMKDIMSFYLNMTVDGFRVDAVPYLAESTELLNEPEVPGCQPVGSWGCLNHTFTMNQEKTYDVLSQLKQHLDDWSNKTKEEKIMIVEATLPPSQVMEYYSHNGKDTSTMAFNFQFLGVDDQMEAKGLEGLITDWTSHLLPNKWSNWLTGNHDNGRVGSKTGPGLIDAMNMINLLLPGTSFTYYGEELGMTNLKIKCDEVRDPQAIAEAKRTGGGCKVEVAASRDPERTPMQWNKNNQAGFSNSMPWLPVNPDYYKVNVEAEKTNEKSHLNIYKNLVNLKKEMADYEELVTQSLSKYVFSFRRYSKAKTGQEYIIMVNLNNYEETVNTTGIYAGDTNLVRAISTNSQRSINDHVQMDQLTLLPKEAIVLAKSSSSLPQVSLTIIFLSMILSLYR